MRRVLLKNENQHRRTAYWQAFRRCHAAVLRVLAVATTVDAATFVLTDDGCAQHLSPERLAAVSVLERMCSQAAICIIVNARRIGAQQGGIAFAGLVAILISATARYAELILALRDELKTSLGYS